MAEFTFNEVTHTYMLGDRELPSVTRIIKPIQSYAGIPKATMEYAREMGNAIHDAIKLWHEDDLDIESLDPQLIPRFEAWMKFIEDFSPEVLGFEEPMFSRLYNYAGMPDFWFRVGNDYYLPDIKPNSMFTWYPIQLAGYQQIVKETKQLNHLQRATLQLKDDGRYYFTPYKRADDAKDFSVFQSLLTIHNWRENNDRRRKDT